MVDPALEVPDPEMDLVDAFFQHIYPLPSYAFLHPATTKRRCREGAQPGSKHSSLRAAICAVAAHYLDRDRDAQASQWTELAEQAVWQNLASPTVPLLQTLLLVIHHRMGAGLFPRAFMLTATAARFAAAMICGRHAPASRAHGSRSHGSRSSQAAGVVLQDYREVLFQRPAGV